MNHDSSLQVGRTWQSSPSQIHQHAPRKCLWNLPQSLISHSRDRAVSSSGHRIPVFRTVFLASDPLGWHLLHLLKNLNARFFFSGQISGVLLFRFLWGFLLHCLFSALTLLTAEILFWLQIFCEALSGWVSFLKNKNESLAYSAFLIPSPAAF